MKTTMKMASVLAVVAGVSFVSTGEAQAGGKFWGGLKNHVAHQVLSSYSHKPKPYVRKECITPCHEYHYGYCAFYKRYSYCPYFVPGPVGGPPPVGTLPAPRPGSGPLSPPNGLDAQATQPASQPAASQAPASQNANVAANVQNASEKNAESNPADASGKLDPAQLAVIVAAVEQVLAKQQPAEQPKVDPEILKALEQLVAQKVAEATQTAAADAAPTAEQPMTVEASPGESNDASLQALREILAQLAASEQAQK